MSVLAKHVSRRRRLSSPIVILAGGEGTRLRPLTLTRPKSMIPLGKSPVIDHLISRISESGFNKFIVTVNYEKEQVMNYLGNGDRFGVKINYAVEPEGIFLGTAGSVKIVDHLLKETFMIVQGDAFTTINLKNALDFHKNSNADVTLILKEVPNPWLYGTVVIDNEGLIKEFQEKPQKGQELSNLISTGIYCLEPEVLDFITPGECDFAKNVFPNLLNEGKKLLGYAGQGFWADIGSLEGYLDGARQVLETHILSQKSDAIESMIGRKVTMGERVILRQPVLIEDKVTINKNCQIGPHVVLKEEVQVVKIQ
jgi:NDP-sugar pyrophosphorylase family protein